jgi:ABC-type spermidine/putrescine transport system permease subunit I
MSTLAWRWLFDPSYSVINWILEHLGLDRISWLGETGWARFSVILANVWFGAPFFMIMYLASLKSVVGILSGDMPFGATVVVTKPQANFPDSVLPVARC